MSYYYTAEVCLNGYCTTNRVEDRPEQRSKYYPSCGSETIAKCSHCSTNIRGDYETGAIVIGFLWYPSKFCYACGEPYPWTVKGLTTAQELADELDELTKAEKDQLKQSISQLIKDTPQTELASVRYKRMFGKISETSGAALNNIITSIAAEAAKLVHWSLIPRLFPHSPVKL